MCRSDLGEFIQSKLVKFLTVGILNTLFGYAVFAILLFVGFAYPVALFLATIIGVIFNFFNFGKVVFSDHCDWMKFLKFVAVYVAIYAVNGVGLRILVQYFMLNPYVGQLICMTPSVLLSWFLMNYWTFKRG